ncbi:MAG: group II intron reverse transcriptase/maturase, partial [Planctomycetes bacterium]|nr:group II intron reverse transcriptase/maturase [Planctomycetota bacterium]
SLRENRDTSAGSGSKPDNMGKDNIRNPIEYAAEESDDAIVPEKLANKGTAVPAELAEESASAKRNSKQKATTRIQGRDFVSNGLQRVRQSVRFNARTQGRSRRR